MGCPGFLWQLVERNSSSDIGERMVPFAFLLAKGRLPRIVQPRAAAEARALSVRRHAAEKDTLLTSTTSSQPRQQQAKRVPHRRPIMCRRPSGQRLLGKRRHGSENKCSAWLAAHKLGQTSQDGHASLTRRTTSGHSRKQNMTSPTICPKRSQSQAAHDQPGAEREVFGRVKGASSRERGANETRSGAVSFTATSPRSLPASPAQTTPKEPMP